MTKVTVCYDAKPFSPYEEWEGEIIRYNKASVKVKFNTGDNERQELFNYERHNGKAYMKGSNTTWLEYREINERFKKSHMEDKQKEYPVGKWVDITDIEPPKGTPVLVTNNKSARNNLGQMSHVWLSDYIFIEGGFYKAYTDELRLISGVEAWYAFPKCED